MFRENCEERKTRGQHEHALLTSKCYSWLNSPLSPIHPKKKLFGIFIASFIEDF
jgi:hypothetical protein